MTRGSARPGMPSYAAFFFFERIKNLIRCFPSESAFSLRGEKAPKDAPERGLLQSRPLSGLSPPKGRGFGVPSRKSSNPFLPLSPCIASRHCAGDRMDAVCLSLVVAGFHPGQLPRRHAHGSACSTRVVIRPSASAACLHLLIQCAVV